MYQYNIFTLTNKFDITFKYFNFEEILNILDNKNDLSNFSIYKPRLSKKHTSQDL